MTTKITGTVLLSLAISIASFAQPILKSNLHIGFAYPISSHGSHAAEYTNNCSIHAISGVSYSEQAFCASGVASIVKDSVTGVVASGIANIIGGRTTGVQAAGFINYTTSHITGVQAAGFINLSGSVLGTQAAGFANICTQHVMGVQASGFVNTAKNATTQAAGFINLSDSNQAQVAGFINVARHTQGAQIAGFANVADNVAGTQIAGFINIARKVKGAQISGFINIADSCDYPIGIINIIKNGEKHIGVMMDETGTTYATFRSGGRVLYGIVGIGYNGTNYRDIFATQCGMGVHLRVSRNIRINSEATITSLTDFRHNSDLQTGIKIMPTFRTGKFEFFAGPSFGYAISYGAAPFNHQSIWKETIYGYTNDVYIGFQAGAQFHF